MFRRMKYSDQLKVWRAERARIVSMLAQGISAETIAKAFGISRQRVYQRAIMMRPPKARK